METQEQKRELEHLDKMIKANERAEVILEKLLAEGELSTHEVLNALAFALIFAANNCEVSKDAFFTTLDARWEEVQEGIQIFNDAETLH